MERTYRDNDIDDDNELPLASEDEPAMESPEPLPTLPYSMMGKILLPLITSIVVIAAAYMFYSVLSSLGGFEPRVFVLVGAVAFTILSQTFLINGTKDLVNHRADPGRPVNIGAYIINAALWIPFFGFTLYSAIRSFITYHGIGISLAFYVAVPALVLAAFALFQSALFVLVARGLKK
ncbi:MAG TPA: hypothetical protein PLX77_01755, partial [Candidatus Cloacimonadota bacterium]|nr:hypothetical protein [Candidatus Cloacimonadota bacterium]